MHKFYPEDLGTVNLLEEHRKRMLACSRCFPSAERSGPKAAQKEQDPARSLGARLDGDSYLAIVHRTGGKEADGMVRARQHQARRRVPLDCVQVLPEQGEKLRGQGTRSSHNRPLLSALLARVRSAEARGHGTSKDSSHQRSCWQLRASRKLSVRPIRVMG